MRRRCFFYSLFTCEHEKLHGEKLLRETMSRNKNKTYLTVLEGVESATVGGRGSGVSHIGDGTLRIEMSGVEWWSCSSWQ